MKQPSDWNEVEVREAFAATARECDTYLRQLNESGKAMDAKYHAVHDLNLVGFCAANHLEHSAVLKSREALLAHLKKMMGWAARVGGLAYDAKRFDEYWRSHIQGLMDAYSKVDSQGAKPRDE
jgi:hypothetical protein